MIGDTLPEIRRLLISLIQSRAPGPESIWSWSRWRRRRQQPGPALSLPAPRLLTHLNAVQYERLCSGRFAWPPLPSSGQGAMAQTRLRDEEAAARHLLPGTCSAAKTCCCSDRPGSTL